MQILNLRFAVLALDEVADHFHGTGTIQRHHGHNVIYARRLELGQPLAHSPAFELEHADRIAARKQIIRFLIMLFQNRPQVHLHAALVQHLKRARQHCERPQSQKVHLEQTDLVHDVHVELRGHTAVRLTIQRNVIGQRPRRNHNSGGMCRGVAIDAFEHLADFPNLAVLRLLVQHRFEFRIFVPRITRAIRCPFRNP